MRRLAVVSLLVTFAATSHAAPAAGTLADPISLPENPFLIAGSTLGRASEIDRYSCDPALDESGGEVVFALDVPFPGKLSAWVEGDGGGVDVDVHVLDGLEVVDGTATACLARGNQIVEPEVEAGTIYVVVDTFDGEAQAGDFVLHVTLIGDDWTELELYEGVLWRGRRYADVAGGPQVVHELSIDVENPAVSLQSLAAEGCQTVAAIAEAAGAVAAVNGGYFGGASCGPVSLLKHDGEVLGLNAVTRSAFGLDASGAPMIELVAQGADWPEATEAQGGGPRLAEAGAPLTSNSDYAEEGITSKSFIGVNPRTVAGIAADGRVSLLVVDGRRPNAAGMSLPALAELCVSELSHVDTVNLDGGGSSTAWLRGMTPSGVLNYPSDGGTSEPATHAGSRAVSGGLFVFAPPKAFAPVISTTPPGAADLAAAFVYDADAYDKNPLDVVEFSVEGGPSGLSVDSASGEVSYQPAGTPPAQLSFTLVASDGLLEDVQTIEMSIPGGVDPAAGGGGQGGATTGGQGAHGEGGEAGDDGAQSGDGCSCRAAAHGSTRSLAWLALTALALSAVRARTPATAARPRPPRCPRPRRRDRRRRGARPPRWARTAPW